MQFMKAQELYQLAEEIFPICRSITGEGVRKTIQILKQYAPAIEMKEIPSGTPVFDWTVPPEWNIYEAYIENSKGSRILDFQGNNLAVVGYSYPMDEYLNLEELKKIIFTQENQPDVTPYVTSYYKKNSGFCMPHRQFLTLEEDTYHAVIRSSVDFEGNLTYGEAYYPGETEEEILISTYICHPSMANNECSGPVISTALQTYISGLKRRRYSYRFLFLPETIGSISYLSMHLERMKKQIVSGLVLSCVGDQYQYSYIQTRYHNTLTDRLMKHLLTHNTEGYKEYSFLQRGSDERQFCAPGVDLPIGTFCRTKFGEFDEYHTSADNLDYISAEGLDGSFQLLKKYVQALEENKIYQVTCYCEPQLGKRGLYPQVSKKNSYDQIRAMMNLIAYADGTNDLLEIAEIINEPIDKLAAIACTMEEQGLFRIFQAKY